MQTKLFNPVFFAVPGLVTVLSLLPFFPVAPAAMAQAPGSPAAQQIANLNAELTARNRAIAAMHADLQTVCEEVQKMRAVIEEQGRQLHNRDIDYRKLVQDVALLNKANADLQRQVEGLQAALNNESQARTKAINELISETSKMIADVGSRQAAARPAGRPPATSEARGVYKVQRGDTLSAIAQAYGVSVQELKDFNKISNDTIREGQELSIPKAR